MKGSTNFVLSSSYSLLFIRDKQCIFNEKRHLHGIPKTKLTLCLKDFTRIVLQHKGMEQIHLLR